MTCGVTLSPRTLATLVFYKPQCNLEIVGEKQYNVYHSIVKSFFWKEIIILKLFIHKPLNYCSQL